MIITDSAATMNDHPQQRLRLRSVVVALLIAFTTVVVCNPVGTAQSNNLDAFARCLGEKNATMYGSFLCSHCEDQKKLFGPSFQYVPYVECSVRGSRQMTFPCMAAQIRLTPTWIFADGERRTGVQPLKDLSVKTACKLP
jgi:hypothetical protein